MFIQIIEYIILAILSFITIISAVLVFKNKGMGDNVGAVAAAFSMFICLIMIAILLYKVIKIV